MTRAGLAIVVGCLGWLGASGTGWPVIVNALPREIRGAGVATIAPPLTGWYKALTVPTGTTVHFWVREAPGVPANDWDTQCGYGPVQDQLKPFKWDFDDGTVIETSFPTVDHAFAMRETPTPYTVKVTIDDDANVGDPSDDTPVTDSLTIYVWDANITALPSSWLPFSLSTRLTNAIDAIQNYVPVVSTNGEDDGVNRPAPAQGTLRIGGEEILYTGKTATEFTGCTRGANGSTAAAHDADAEVQWATFTPPFTATILGPPNVSGKITFVLRGVSSEPGFCLNGGEYTGSDLVFDEQPGLIRYEQHTIYAEGVGQASAAVSCRDCGAYTARHQDKYGEWHEGGIEAQVGVPFVPQEVFVGSVVAWVENITPPVRIQEIPVQRKYDNLSNHIAQDWPYSSGGADDDNDNTPAGDGTVGDGLSRYEEYRGLLLAEDDWKLTRLNPDEKDMVVEDLEPQGLGTVEYFPGAGMPQVYRFEGAWQRTGSLHLMNWNYQTHHLHDVYAAWMFAGVWVGNPSAYGATWGAYYTADAHLLINEELIHQDVQGTNHTYEELRDWVIGHELGHTVLWHRPDRGHHAVQNFQDCLMGPYAYAPAPTYPQEFCYTLPGTSDPGCQRLWHFTP